ncbi:MAG: procyclic acidic repetitive family protein [Archangium sp.]
MFASVLIMLLGASDVSVTVAPGVVCVERTRVVTRLEQSGLRVLERSERLAVSIDLVGARVRVRGVKSGGVTLERSVAAKVDDCAAIERVLVALISSWSTSIPAPPTQPPLLAKRGEGRGEGPSAAPTERAVAEPVTEPIPESIPEPVPDLIPDPVPEPVVEREPVPVAETAPPPAVESAPLPSPLPVSQGEGVAIELAAFGGTSIGPTTSFTGRGQANVTLAFHRLGIGLDVGLDSARTRTVSPVTMESTTQWASLHGHLYFHPLERLRLELSLGLRVWRITATSTGADTNATTALASLGPLGAAHASIRIVGPLSFQALFFTSARYRAERFTVTNLGPVLELLPWEFGLLGGLQLDAGL